MRARLVPLIMDAVHPEQDPDLIAVAELLGRHRSVLTFDERERVDRRVHSAMNPQRRARLLRSRLASIVCISLGVVFTTGGTGLAISGFASVGPAVHAQYPDQASPTGTPNSGTGSQRRRDKHTGSPATTSSSPRTLRQVPSTPQPGTTAYVTLQHAETHSDLPFTGFDALPVLGAGIAMLLGGGVLRRTTRQSQIT